MSIDIQIKDQGLKLPNDAIGIIEMVEKIEQRTIQLRKEIMRELRPDGNIIHLKLNKVNDQPQIADIWGVSNICY